MTRARDFHPCTLTGTGRVLLLGMIGVGKSSVGRELASLTGWPYLDNDDLLRSSTGRNARELLNQEGVDGLHQAEFEVLRTISATPAPLIAGVAASVVLKPCSEAELRSIGTLVYLRASATTLVSRLADQVPREGSGHRPWVDTQGPEVVVRLLRERTELYEEVADFAVDTDLLDPRRLALIIWRLLRSAHYAYGSLEKG